MADFDPKKIIFGDEVIKKFLSGAKIVYDAVTTTMGSSGNFVVYEESGRLYPTITKDGVSVARRIQLTDKYEDMVAQLMIESANKQVRETGDGTTLTILLTYEMYKAGIEAIKNNQNRALFRSQLQKQIDYIQEELRKIALSVDEKRLLDIATISCNNDRELGLLIAEAIEKVGDLGIVTSAKSQTSKNYIDYSTGYRWKKGIEYPEFMTTRGRLEYTDCNIVVTNEPIMWANDIVALHEIVKDYPTVIIAPNIKEEAMGAIRHNTQKGNCRLAVICPECLGESQLYELQDIASLTGAKLLSAETGNQLRNIKKEDIGKCESISSTMLKDTTIIGGNPETLQKRINELKFLLEEKKGCVEENMLKNSIAKLAGGIAEIRIHANTETEQREIMDRVDDAILACKSAKEEGIVEGGGVALLKVSKEMDNCIMKDVITKPAIKILSNADACEATIIEIVKEARGYNVYDDFKDVDMINIGVIDPLKVIRTALNNAFSISGLLLQTTCCIAEEVQNDK